MRTVKCIVAALNADGEPDLYFVKVRCTQEAYDSEGHYERAKEKAREDGYEPCLAYDENDSAGHAMLRLFTWQTAPIVAVESKLEVPGIIF